MKTLISEGLRAAPWFHELSRRGSLAINDCGRCRDSTSKLQRQSLGCGYEPRTDRVHLTVWQPPTGKNGYTGAPLTTCAGYTANLPEVTEAMVARMHWSKGNVAFDRTPKRLLDEILIVESGYAQVQAWAMAPASEGGGRAPT